MASKEQPLRAINRIMSTLATKMEVDKELVWLGRTEIVNATDEEITAKFDGTVFAADIVADDSRAATYEYGRLTMSSDKVPNLKHGIRLTQSQLNMLRRYQQDVKGAKGETDIFTDWQNRRTAALLRGVRKRMEALIVAAKVDAIVYDRLGIKINGSFGTPSDLKSIVDTLWSNTSAKPITDLQAKKAYAEDTYGRTYNRATMSRQEFANTVATTEFQNKAALQFKFSAAPDTISPYDADAPRLWEAITGMQLDIYTFTMKTKKPDASVVMERPLPAGKVLLTNSADDKNEDVFDFANGIVSESIITDILPTLVEGLDGEQFGPAAFIAPTNADLNPPQIAMWGVARGFPRKHDESECAVLTVG